MACHTLQRSVMLEGVLCDDYLRLGRGPRGHRLVAEGAELDGVVGYRQRLPARCIVPEEADLLAQGEDFPATLEGFGQEIRTVGQEILLIPVVHLQERLQLALRPGFREDLSLDVRTRQLQRLLRRVERRAGIGSRRARRGNWRSGEIDLRALALSIGFNRDDLPGSRRAADLKQDHVAALEAGGRSLQIHAGDGTGECLGMRETRAQGVPSHTGHELIGRLEGLRQLTLFGGNALDLGASTYDRAGRRAFGVVHGERDIGLCRNARAQLVAYRAGQLEHRTPFRGHPQKALVRDPLLIEGEHIPHRRPGVEERDRRVIAGTGRQLRQRTATLELAIRNLPPVDAAQHAPQERRVRTDPVLQLRLTRRVVVPRFVGTRLTAAAGIQLRRIDGVAHRPPSM